MNFFQKFLILDFTQRLPGPYASMILGQLGLQVIKIEDEENPDPFDYQAKEYHQRSFPSWYQEMNQAKKILKLNCNSKDDVKKLHELLRQCDGILLPHSSPIQKKLQLDLTTLSKLDRPKKSLAILEVKSGRDDKLPMHDLNALAESGLLNLYLANLDPTLTMIPPPFLPLAGMSFGQYMATEMLSLLMESRETQQVLTRSTYLVDVAKNLLRPLWSEDLENTHLNNPYRYLHNGAYPCYHIYQTADDHYLAFAAVEEKYWLKAKELFSIPIPNNEDRFSTDENFFQLMAQTFKQYSLDECRQLLKNHNICLTPIEMKRNKK